MFFGKIVCKGTSFFVNNKTKRFFFSFLMKLCVSSQFVESKKHLGRMLSQ